MSRADSEDDPADSIKMSPVTDARLFDDGLQQVHEDITTQLATVEREGEQIKQVVGYALIGSQADPATARNLQQQLIKLLGELHDSDEGVTLDDIVLALWSELIRVSEMAFPDEEGEVDGESTDESDVQGDAGAEDEAAEDEPEDEGLAELFGSADAEESDTETTPPDPAFQ